MKILQSILYIFININYFAEIAFINNLRVLFIINRLNIKTI